METDKSGKSFLSLSSHLVLCGSLHPVHPKPACMHYMYMNEFLNVVFGCMCFDKSMSHEFNILLDDAFNSMSSFWFYRMMVDSHWRVIIITSLVSMAVYGRYTVLHRKNKNRRPRTSLAAKLSTVFISCLFTVCLSFGAEQEAYSRFVPAAGNDDGDSSDTERKPKQ